MLMLLFKSCIGPFQLGLNVFISFCFIGVIYWYSFRDWRHPHRSMKTKSKLQNFLNRKKYITESTILFLIDFFVQHFLSLKSLKSIEEMTLSQWMMSVSNRTFFVLTLQCMNFSKVLERRIFMWKNLWKNIETAENLIVFSKNAIFLKCQKYCSST